MTSPFSHSKKAIPHWQGHLNGIGGLFAHRIAIKIDIVQAVEEALDDALLARKEVGVGVLNHSFGVTYPFADEHSVFESVEALCLAIAFFGYSPKVLQTDNGNEFTDRAFAKPGSKYAKEGPYLLGTLCQR